VNDSSLPPDIQQALDLFRAQFAEQLPARLAEASQGLDACLAAPDDDDRLRELYRVLHRLAGSAGTFGMPAFGAACRVIEDALEALLARHPRARADFDEVERALAALPRPAAPAA
jgi:HPt (histidine-containing phosphotransfer) domain-containing protein